MPSIWLNDPSGSAGKSNFDLVLLMDRPDQPLNSLRVVRRGGSESPSVVKQVKSSANWFNFRFGFPTERPLMAGFFRILVAKTSATRTKRDGERGHPCLTPLAGWKNPKSVRSWGCMTPSQQRAFLWWQQIFPQSWNTERSLRWDPITHYRRPLRNRALLWWPWGSGVKLV